MDIYENSCIHPRIFLLNLVLHNAGGCDFWVKAKEDDNLQVKG